MKGWKEIYFNDFIKLNRGFDLPNHLLVDGKYPVVTSTEIKSFHNEFKVKGPGVITGRSGSLGTVQYVEGNYWPHNTTLYIKDFKGNFPKFVYYFLQTMHLENFNSGAGVPSLNQNHLHKQKIVIPSDYEIQRRIASILSAYDELIEVNTQRIKLLEETARELFKEWFVRMRFPGYKEAKFVKGVPERWELKKIGDVCKVARGSSPRPIVDTRYFENGTIPWVKIADATESGKFLFETKEYVNEFGASFSRKLEPGSLIIATSGTLGFCIFLAIEACVHDGWLYTFDYKKGITSEFLFYVINERTEYFNNLSYGAAIQNINTDILRNAPFMKPSNEILQKFQNIIININEQQKNLQQQNTQLRQIRDRLLPRLISGKLEVKPINESDKNEIK